MPAPADVTFGFIIFDMSVHFFVYFSCFLFLFAFILLFIHGEMRRVGFYFLEQAMLHYISTIKYTAITSFIERLWVLRDTSNPITIINIY